MKNNQLDKSPDHSILEDGINSLEYKSKIMEDRISMMEQKISRLEKQNTPSSSGYAQNDQGSRKTG